MEPRRASPVTVLCIVSGDLWAGAEVMVFNLLSALKGEAGVNAAALLLNDGILSRKLQEIGVETHVISERANAFGGIIWKASRLFRGRTFQVIHSHRYKENLLAFALSRLRKVGTLMTTIHGMPEAVGGNGVSDLRPADKVNFAVLRRFFRPVAAVSHEMKATLTAAYGFEPERVTVVHNGISLPESRHEVGVTRPRDGAARPFHLGTVGRMVPVKDYSLFLDIAADIRNKTGNVRFSILGDGPLKPVLRDKAKALKLDDAVEFVEPCSDPWPYYRSLDVYLNCSRHEGLPMSVLEAMACGKPVVAAAVGGIPEVISHGEDGYLVRGRDPLAFVRPCLDLLRETALAERMGRAAIQTIESRFGVDRMAASYRELYGC
ncbi:MAG: glycosyltransferase [Nitrospiria bacterium]